MSVSQAAAVAASPHSNRPLAATPPPPVPPPKRKSIFSAFSLSGRSAPAASPPLQPASTPQSASPTAQKLLAAPAPAALSLGAPATPVPASTPTPSTPSPSATSASAQLPHSHSAPSAAAARGAVNVSAVFPQAMQHFQQQHLSYLHYQQQQQQHQHALSAARQPHPPDRPFPFLHPGVYPAQVHPHGQAPTSQSGHMPSQPAVSPHIVVQQPQSSLAGHPLSPQQQPPSALLPPPTAAAVISAAPPAVVLSAPAQPLPQYSPPPPQPQPVQQSAPPLPLQPPAASPPPAPSPVAASAPAPIAVSPPQPSPPFAAASSSAASSAPPPMETNGPPPPKPALATQPTSHFAQLILAPPKAPPPATAVEDTLKRLRQGLEAIKSREEERIRKESKKREEREERVKRTERVEYELNEKKRQSAYKKQKDEEKVNGGLGGIGSMGGKGVKKMLGKMADSKTEKEIERVRVKKAELVSEREEEKRKDRVRDMDRDERVLLMTAGAATDELSGVSVDAAQLPVLLPSLLSGLACHAHDVQTVGRVLHYLYTMYLTAALNVPASLPPSTTPSPLKQLNTIMYDNGAVGLLVGCLFDHSENAPIQQDALLLLYCLCSDKVYAETCVNNGGINAVAIALTNHPNLPLLLAASVAILTRLAVQLPQYLLLMLQSDVLPLLLSTLAAHPNNELVAYHALGTFALLATSSAEHCVLLGESGVVEAVIMAMYTFPASLLLQREALHALAALCNEQIENGRKIYRNSGIQASMLAVSKHAGDDVEVLQSALRVLMELEWQQLITQKALEAVDGLAVLLTAAAAHITLLDVQKQLMAAVAVTCEHSVELQSKAIARGVVDHLLTLSKQFGYTYGTEQLWAAMCQCVRHLSTADVNKPQLSTAVLVSLLFSALKLHVTSDSVAVQAVASLAHLTDHADDAARRLLVSQVGDGGMVVVLHVMECHSATRAVIEQCVIVLYNLLRNHVDYQRQLILADGIPALLTACKDHSSSEIVCRHVLAVFSLLSDSMDEKELFLRMHGDSINQILIAMRNHPSSLPLQCYALLTLRNLTNKFDCGPTKSAEIIDVTLVKMKAFPLSAAVQQYASECLWNLALTDATNKRKMQGGEGIALVLAARRVHNGVFDVTHATNGLLDVLECSIAEEGKEEKSWEQVQEEGLQHEAELLIAQLHSVDTVDVQLHGMDRLCALAAASSSIHSLLLGHLDVLFNALRSHPETELIQLAGLNILGRLSSTATAVAAVTEQGGIAAALTALSPIPSSPLLLENAVSLLRLLASESTNCYLIGRTGGLELVLEGMTAFQQFPSVQEHSIRCVAVLLARDENKQQLMVVGGLDLLAAALQACGGRSVVAAETVVSCVDAMLRWGGGGVMTVNMYWALVNAAHAFPWHTPLQQQCGAMLPYFHHLASQPPQATPPPIAMTPSLDAAGPPGGAAYAPAPAPSSPRAAAHLNGVKVDEQRQTPELLALEHREEAKEQLVEDNGIDHKVDEEEEEENDEDEDDEEDEDEDEEKKEEEDGADVDDVKEGEERTPVTASPVAEEEEDNEEEKEDRADEKKTEAVHEDNSQHEQPTAPAHADEASDERGEVKVTEESEDDIRQPVDRADDQQYHGSHTEQAADEN